MNGLRATLLATGLLLLPPLFATELQSGVQYAGGQQLTSANIGIGFDVPADWQGVLGDDGHFYMQSENHQGMLMVTAAPAMAPEQVAANLAGQPLDLGDGVILYPLGQAQQRPDRVTQQYQGMLNGVELRGTMRVLIGDYQYLMTLISVGTQPETAYFAKTMDRLTASARFFQPQVAARSSDAPGGRSDSQTFINQSQNGSVVSGRNSDGQNCTYVSAGGMSFKSCD